MKPRKTSAAERKTGPRRHVASAGPARYKDGPRVRPRREGPLHVELISVGRDLLKGSVRDANGPWLAERLSSRGALVHRITVVDDHEQAIEAAVAEALLRQPHLVVTSGGLGPAADDRTLSAVAGALQLPLTASPPARQMVEDAYRRLRQAGILASDAMTRAREKTCSVPVGGHPIANPIGIAPGVLVRLTGGAAVLCLPGEPDEMRAVFEAGEPLLRDLFPRRHRAVREVEAPTADESELRPLLDRLSAEYPMVFVTSRHPGFKSKGSRVVLSLEASCADRGEAESAVDCAVKRLLALAAGVR